MQRHKRPKHWVDIEKLNMKPVSEWAKQIGLKSTQTLKVWLSQDVGGEFDTSRNKHYNLVPEWAIQVVLSNRMMKTKENQTPDGVTAHVRQV